MIFETFIKPKWQHRSPEIRQAAIETLDDPTILLEMAQRDEDATVRRAALKKINDLNILYQIAQQDTDSTVRELASQRLKQLLCCQKDDCPSLEARLAMVNRTTDVELLAYVAERGIEVELRLTAVGKLEQEELLGNIAINDNNNDVRLAAVDRLRQPSTLERVFKAVRNRDKRLSRRVREKLDHLLEQLEHPKQVRSECEAICGRLEGLERRLLTEQATPTVKTTEDSSASKSWKPETMEFKRLQERWDAIAAEEVASEFQARFQQAKQAVLNLFDHHQQAIAMAQQREQLLAPLRAAKQSLCEQIDALSVELKNYHHLGGEAETQFQQRLQTIQDEWNRSPSLDDVDEDKQWHNRFTRLLQALQKRQAKLQENHQLASQLEAVCTEAEGLLNTNAKLKPEQLKEFQSRWQAVVQPTPVVEIFNQLNQQFAKLTAALETRLKEQRDQREKTIQEVKQLLKELEVALDNGELKTAMPLEKQAREKLEELSGTQHQTLEKRFHDCTTKINQLRGWQRWGSKLERENICQQAEELLQAKDNPNEALAAIEGLQTSWKRLGSVGHSQELHQRFHNACTMVYQRYREHLCGQMEGLLVQEIPPEEAARKIRHAQDVWKNLGSQGHTTELWERFNQACQSAYEPCKTHFNIMAQERERNFYEKQSLCERLEKFVAETDWEHADWKEVYRFSRELQKSWYLIGTTDRKRKKPIQQQFQTAMQRLESHLEEERQRSCRYRLRLLGQVEQVAQRLKDFISTSAGIEANPVLDQANEVRRELSKKASEGRIHEGSPASHKKTVEGKINDAIEEVKKLQEQWQVTIPGSRRVEREFWNEFREVCDVVFNYRKQQQESVKKELQTYLQAKMAICEQVEALATLTGDAIKTAPSQVKKLKEEWKAIKTDWSGKTSTNSRKKIKAEAVDERFEKACQLVDEQYHAQLASEHREQMVNLKRKARFCAELEQSPSLLRPELEANFEEVLAKLQVTWQELPRLINTELETAVEQRFQQAYTALASGSEIPVSEEVLKHRETLCIRMEILAGIESPSEATQARLAYQVARLSSAMRGGDKKSVDKQVEAEEIERSWYLSSAAPASQTQQLEERFERAWQAFWQNSNR